MHHAAPTCFYCWVLVYINEVALVCDGVIYVAPVIAVYTLSLNILDKLPMKVSRYCLAVQAATQ
jgi:hypothetical protein